MVEAFLKRTKDLQGRQEALKALSNRRMRIMAKAAKQAEELLANSDNVMGPDATAVKSMYSKARMGIERGAQDVEEIKGSARATAGSVGATALLQGSLAEDFLAVEAERDAQYGEIARHLPELHHNSTDPQS